MAEDDTPLTALCALCHINTIKYTCPRCFIHTCSLKCVKLHKKRAQCSGIRDPGAYVRRSELTTESGIDRDFNFISGVERGIERLEEQHEQIVPVGVGWSRKSANWDQATRAAGVTIVRAPEGMSRRKMNKSSAKGNGLMWTVEWLFNGEKRVVNVPDSRTVGETFIGLFGKKAGRKRKRDDAKDEPAKDVDVDGAKESEETSVPSPEHTDKCRKSSIEGLYFYLHRPQTSSKVKCLIPVDSRSNWKEILKGRTVLEFPTVHVREEPPEDIPKPFILERDYIERGEDVVVQPVLASAVEPELPDLDPNKLLEVLKADLNS
jgi:hypothetical protein